MCGSCPSVDQLNKVCFAGEGFCQRFIQRGQTASMLAGERNRIAVGDLIRAGHQVGSHHTVGGTQVVGDEANAAGREKRAARNASSGVMPKPSSGCEETRAKPSWEIGHVAKVETPLNERRTLV